MLVVETIARIRRDHLVRGVPIKKIARDLRVSKNTVRKVVRGDETSYSYERKIQPMPKLGPWVGELERRLEANEKKPRRDRLSLLRIHEDLAALGYGGGYDAVRRYARTWRRRWRLLSPSQGFVPLSFDPGEAYQFDWSHEYARLSGVTTKVKAAHMRLCYSRMQLVQIFPRASQEMVFEAHERAFHFFGGVCRRGIYDNMKTAVEHGLRAQGARLQPALSGAVLPPSGGAGGVYSGCGLGEGAGREAGGLPPRPPVRAHPAGPLLRRDQRVADGSVYRGRQETAASDD